ncbi:hypothetical protein CRM22_004032 [Opisthorchis felineus]|uniref:Uncharacterized protein n=2 Tax=Opisthorchis felineus TaxID=147828 RepID=A0A4S2LY89_OPIFE|nr:hypothetical protein CRM22_004032 [Opisthorchis felineus]
MLGLDLRDSRLKDVIEPLEKGNFKKALLEVNKVLRKTPSCSTSKLLKALVLLKSGKTTEAVTLAEEIIGAYPTDESTLNVVMCYFRETGQTHREAEYLKTALKKCPDREDLLVYLFLNQVQSGSFAEQQTTARLLSQQFPSPLYIYWVIVSTTMQAEADPVLGKRMYLPLAEKMLLREASANKMRKHSEFQLLLDVLRRLGKQNDALKFLNNSTLIDRLDELDYRCDYSIERLNLHVVLDLWEDAFKLGEEKLNQNPNDWNVWKFLIELSTAQSTRDLNAPRIDRLDSLLSTFMDRHPNVRGPHLARLDLSANLLRRGWDLPHNTDVSSLLYTYINKFAVKPICAFDVAYLLPLFLPAEAQVTQFLSTLMGDNAKTEIQVPADSKQAYRHLCAYQVARANRYPVSLIDLIQTYFAFVPERATFPPNLPKQLGDEQANASAVDLCPADGFLLLVLSTLSENPTLPTVSHGPGALALALLAAYWVEYSGVARASNNHHFRLRLCSLFSPHALACTDMSLAQTDRLDVKQLLYVSLGYTIISANPMLTLWSSIQSQTSQHQQQADTSPMLAFHHHVRDLSGVTVNEARDGISAAYRRGAYVKVREFTRFADRLRHADVFLTTRIELLYWQLAVVPDNFDSLLEIMGSATKELQTVTERLEGIVDCRDFFVSPNFDPPFTDKHTQQGSFVHLVRWLHLRLGTVRILHKCSELVMGSVNLGDQLCSSGMPDSPIALDERSIKACEQLDRFLNADLKKLLVETPCLHGNMADWTLEKLIESLVLPPEHLFTAPPRLPTTQMATLYLHGPFGQVLDAGVRLVLGLYRLLSQGEEYFPAEQECELLCLIKGDSTDLSAQKSSSGFLHSILKNVSSLENIGKAYLFTENACHPAGVILLLGALFETLALQCLFLSMIRSILLPRSHFHLRSGKQQRRKANKAQRGKHTGGTDRTNHVDASGPLEKRLDILGSRVFAAVNDIFVTTQKLAAVTEAWTQWAKIHACEEFHQLASQFSHHLLSEEMVKKYPVLVPEPRTSLFKEVAKSHEKTFDRLLTGFRMKQASLTRMQNELLVYEQCVKKMSECLLDESVS